MADAPLLEARNLSVEFATREGVVRAVSEVDLDLAAGETLAIVGESGSGKSQMLLSMLGLVARNARVTRKRAIQRRGTVVRFGGAPEPNPRLRHRPRLPGSDDLAESLPLHRTSIDGALARS